MAVGVTCVSFVVEQFTDAYFISCEFPHWPQLAAAAVAATTTTTHTLL